MPSQFDAHWFLKNRMVSSCTEKSKEATILGRNNLSDHESIGYKEPKKRNRITWTIDLHEKFLEAVEALGGDGYATPEAILHQMYIKGLTAKHISSHLQKHRLRHQNAEKDGQRQENSTRKRFPELIISAHDEATSKSNTPRVETDGEVYPLRLWTKMKKRSVDMYISTSGNCTEETESPCVWDKYENRLQRVFSEKKKRWQFMSKHQWPGKNNIVITDERDTNEAPETIGGASIEISGSSALLPSDQVEAARANDNMGNTTLLEGTSGSGSMLTGGHIRQNSYAEAARDNDNLGSIISPQGYGASTEICGSSMLTSNQLREHFLNEFARDNDHMENINLLEGTVDPEYNVSMDFSVTWAHLESNDLDLIGPSDGREEADSFRMSQQESLGLKDPLQVGDNVCNDTTRSVGMDQGSHEQQRLGMEDLQQVDDFAWDDALISAGLINLLDEPMTEEAAIGGSQDEQSLAPGVLQAGDNAWSDDLRSPGIVNLLDEPIAHEAAIGNALMDDPVSPIAQDDVLWAWSPGTLF